MHRRHVFELVSAALLAPFVGIERARATAITITSGSAGYTSYPMIFITQRNRSNATSFKVLRRIPPAGMKLVGGA